MILLNFFPSRLQKKQREQDCGELTGQQITDVVDLPVQFDGEAPFLPQLEQPAG